MARRLKKEQVDFNVDGWAFKDEGPWQGYLISVIIKVI